MRFSQKFWPLVAYAALGAIVLVGQTVGAGRRAASTGGRTSAEALTQPCSGRDGPHAAGRGLHAAAPWEIPWRGWKDILWRVYRKIDDNRLLSVAAGAVFYALLALFPAVAAFVSLFGLFADPSAIAAHLSMASGVLPGGAIGILHDELTRLAADRGPGLSFGFVLGLAFALWSANSGMKAIIDALNVAYDEKERRSFIRLNLVSLVFTLIAIVLMILAIGAVVVAPIALADLGLGGVSHALLTIVRWPALLALVILALAAAYRYAPDRHEPRWQWLSVGSVAAAAAWLVISVLFSWYIANFGHYNVTYGSLGAALGLMMWMWISMIVILIGAQLNAEIERQAARGPAAGGGESRSAGAAY